ncbi:MULTISPECIES: hypothetical protein [Pseudomonas]|uniref:hypothetical protein n=1 Tax=Pseudomonas TaxID=286 RepID=UPI000AD22052|nr:MULTISPECIES: hypothetical protein [Pseudomonas]AZC16718.1 hypothetical protein C4K40_1306 [Pseudomonas sp. CMR5c]
MEPIRVGTKFINHKGYGDSLHTFIEPAQNVSGAVIRTCSVNGGTLYCSSVKPTGYSLNATPAFFSNPLGAHTMPYEVLIPAGQGVWWAPVNSNSSAMLTYDLLP